jgi:hypothetical protein
MWQSIKHKLGKLGCLCVIALAMIGVTALSKLVLGWFHYDETRESAISNLLLGREQNETAGGTK